MVWYMVQYRAWNGMVHGTVRYMLLYCMVWYHATVNKYDSAPEYVNTA